MYTIPEYTGQAFNYGNPDPANRQRAMDAVAIAMGGGPSNLNLSLSKTPVGLIGQVPVAQPDIQHQSDLLNRFRSGAYSSPAEKNYLLQNIHPALLNQNEATQKFLGANPTMTSKDLNLGNVNDTSQTYQNGNEIYKTYQASQYNYDPLKGITMQNSVPTTVGIQNLGPRAGGAGGGLGALTDIMGRNETELKKAGGVLTGLTMGLMTGNPILAALNSYRGFQNGPMTGTEVLANMAAGAAKGLGPATTYGGVAARQGLTGLPKIIAAIQQDNAKKQMQQRYNDWASQQQQAQTTRANLVEALKRRRAEMVP